MNVAAGKRNAVACGRRCGSPPLPASRSLTATQNFLLMSRDSITHPDLRARPCAEILAYRTAGAQLVRGYCETVAPAMRQDAELGRIRKLGPLAAAMPILGRCRAAVTS